MASEKRVIQWTLDSQEASLVSALMAVGFYAHNEDLAGSVVASLTVEKALDRLGVERANELQNRFERLIKEGFPGEFKVVDLSSVCGHCSCSEHRCCLCGQYKDL